MKTVDEDIEDSETWVWAGVRWFAGIVVVCLGLACVSSGTLPPVPDAPYDAAAWSHATVAPGFDAAVP